ncbi:stalk domain-containing protein [Paenibacillus roseipurpureus]|uniref:Stalk domain-containing protein n=1 Tax=Paenibacillus roseopurpureus TaxID=2918901 RepID=A0AA96LRM4_9BACL|nr:stalk domain-containing protein [Paenibacillus sp. MBLB1832]WNR46785.1 stalk domain-containing protein [Paenibacillus sp. MBLB1832]
MKRSYKMKMALIVVLAASSLLLSYPGLEVSAAGGSSATDPANAAIQYLNGVRSQMGIPVMSLDAKLTKASSNHANYLLANDENGHSETSGKQGYTGEWPWDRASAVGFDTESFGVFEDVSFNTDSPEAGVQSLLDAPLHRSSLILPDMTLLGVGYNNHAIVMNPAKKWYTHSGVGKYPYDGQTGVPIGFYGFEMPNPLEQLHLSQSGYFITYAGVAQEKTSISASLINSSNQPVDILTLKQELGDTNAWHMIPKNVLTYGETYTVTVEGETWSFTTMQNPNAPKQDPVTSPVKTDLPKQFNSNDVGIRLNGTIITLSPKAKIINGSTMIPLRGVFEKMGASVTWDGTRKEITITKGARTIVLTIGISQAWMNGSWHSLSVAPFLSAEGSTYVPLRFVSEALGAEIAWESEKWTAVITQHE